MNGFRDRFDAGRALARKLMRYAQRADVIVLGLPRGGVPVALEVARALGAPLDVLVVRKLGVPSQPELAMGAIALGGVRVLEADVITDCAIDSETIERVTAAERRELARRERAFRGDRPMPQLDGRTVILVDDGIATGATMHAAIKAVRTLRPGAIVVAAPVMAAQTLRDMRRSVDEVACVLAPEQMMSIGAWYEDFSQLSDAQVLECLGRSNP